MAWISAIQDVVELSGPLLGKTCSFDKTWPLPDGGLDRFVDQTGLGRRHAGIGSFTNNAVADQGSCLLQQSSYYARLLVDAIGGAKP